MPFNLIADAVNTNRFGLNLNAEECMRYYRGEAASVVVRSDTGLRIAFPASYLRRFITASGVNGRFEIVFDANHKLVKLEKVG